MTKRDFYKAIINANISEDITTQAEAYIAQLDKENERRRNTPTAKQKDNEVLMDRIVSSMENGVTYTAASLAEVVGESVAKVSALCTKLVERERLIKGETKVKGKGKVKSYTLAD